MARPILSEYGPDASKRQVASAKSGGVKKFRDVLNYQPPQGPKGISNCGPGLGGVNYDNCGTQGPKGTMGSEGGSPGLGGKNRGMGSNRKG